VGQAEARMEQTRRNASIEVKRTLRGVEVAEQSRKVAEQSRVLAQETERLARVSFELGRGTSLELVDAARQLRQSEVQLALREFEVVQAKLRALLALSNCDY
jgi:outer membrane protein TolC